MFYKCEQKSASKHNMTRNKNCRYSAVNSGIFRRCSEIVGEEISQNLQVYDTFPNICMCFGKKEQKGFEMERGTKDNLML